ncbi:uncharacterized protein LOC126237396 [Schistocerca nitens]|uniref:uncharacterized protein LOC126237396 n=1 Tax=Schistocerca nitens TaxID=7011 RepID=UPI0021186501|nr:uncharacterized protein LOC126237396 [Schistocerca nitens]
MDCPPECPDRLSFRICRPAPQHVWANSSSTVDHVAHLTSMLEQDNELLLSIHFINEDTPTLKRIVLGPLHHPSPGQYWFPRHSPSQNILWLLQGQSVDVVDEKLLIPPSALILFSSVYNLTASDSEHLKTGIEAPVDIDWGVALKFENALRSIELQFTKVKWDELCHSELYVNQQMTSKYSISSTLRH